MPFSLPGSPSRLASTEANRPKGYNGFRPAPTVPNGLERTSPNGFDDYAKMVKDHTRHCGCQPLPSDRKRLATRGFRRMGRTGISARRLRRGLVAAAVALAPLAFAFSRTDASHTAAAVTATRLRTAGPSVTVQTLPPNDDESTTTAVPLGFDANFFGTTYNQVFVNNNGNVSFDAPHSDFSPPDLASG